MAHSYKSSYPSGIQIDEGIKAFFEEFYRISDIPDAQEAYANSFTKDAVFVLASKTVKGHDEILALRKEMWTGVATRQHTPSKVFPFGNGASEVMLFGTVAYTLKDGRKADLEWSARAILVKEDETWKLGFYQVYLDTAATQNSK